MLLLSMVRYSRPVRPLLLSMVRSSRPARPLCVCLPSDVRCGLSGVVMCLLQEGIPRGHAFMCLDMAKLPQTMREIFTQNDLM